MLKLLRFKSMPMKPIAKFFIVSISLLASIQLKSQTCGACSINVNSLDSTSYSINAGETFCVDTAGNFIGTITLNGGTICNKGIFNPSSIQFNNGTISNYGNTSLKTSVTIATNAILTNNADAVMNINGGITNSGGTLTNNGIINVDLNIQNNSGSITNNSIINCTQLTGSGTLTNNGKINTN